MVTKECWYIQDDIKYVASGWFGCQLKSYEYIRQRAGAQRTLKTLNRDYEIKLYYTSDRRFFTKPFGRVEHSWTIDLSSDLSEANAQILKFYEDLDGVY